MSSAQKSEFGNPLALLWPALVRHDGARRREMWRAVPLRSCVKSRACPGQVCGPGVTRIPARGAAARRKYAEPLCDRACLLDSEYFCCFAALKSDSLIWFYLRGLCLIVSPLDIQNACEHVASGRGLRLFVDCFARGAPTCRNRRYARDTEQSSAR